MATMKYYNVNTPPTTSSPAGTYYVRRTDNTNRIDIYVVSNGAVKKLENSEERVVQIEQTMITQEDLDNLDFGGDTDFGEMAPLLENLPFLLGIGNPLHIETDAPIRTGYFNNNGLGTWVNSASWRTHQDKAIIVNSPGVKIRLDIPGKPDAIVQFAVMDIFNQPIISEICNSIVMPENGYYLRINFSTGGGSSSGLTTLNETQIKSGRISPIFPDGILQTKIQNISNKLGPTNSWLIQNNLYNGDFFSGFYNNVGAWQAAVNLTVGWLSMRFDLSTTKLPVKKGTFISFEIQGVENAIIRMRIEKPDRTQVTFSNTWKANTPTLVPDDGLLVLMFYTGTIDSTVSQLTLQQIENTRIIGVNREGVNERLDALENPDVTPPVWVTPRIVNNPLPIGKDTLKVLLIGNSYSQNLTNRLSTLVDASNIDQSKLNVSYAMIGGATLATWWNSYVNNTNHTIAKQAGTLNMPVTSGKLSNLLAQDWDVIVLQEYNPATDYGTYNPYLTDLMKAIRTHCLNPRLSIVANAVWSWANSSGSDIQWRGIIEATKQMVIKDGLNVIIPSGTAIQNSRNTSLGLIGNDLTRDGIHLIPGIGEYIAACALFQAILSPVFGVPMFGNPANYTVNANEITIGGASVTDDNRELCQRAALQAWIDPFNITEIIE